MRLNVTRQLPPQVPRKPIGRAWVKLPKRKIGRHDAVDCPFEHMPEKF